MIHRRKAISICILVSAAQILSSARSASNEKQMDVIIGDQMCGPNNLALVLGYLNNNAEQNAMNNLYTLADGPFSMIQLEEM